MIFIIVLRGYFNISQHYEQPLNTVMLIVKQIQENISEKN